MKIVELFGLPGCGKSTVCEIVCNGVSADGVNILTYSDYIAESRGKMAIFRALFTPIGLKWTLNVISMALFNRLWGKGQTVKRLLFCLTFVDFYKRHKKDKNTLIILDEGIVQGSVSAFFDLTCGGTVEKIADILRDLKINCVYIDVSPEIADSRIKMRNEHSHGRCDAMTSEERLPVLSVQRDNFQRIAAEYTGTLTVNGESEVIDIANSITGLLKK